MKEKPEFPAVREDPYFQKYINRPIAEVTKIKFKSIMELYQQYYMEIHGKVTTPTLMLERLKEDREKPILERGEVEREWVEYIVWLTKRKYSRKRGRAARSMAMPTIKNYGAAVKTFYSFFGMPLSKTAKLPPAVRGNRGKIVNEKVQYRPELVKKLVSAIDSNRDRALVLTMFQSGMDLSTTLSLTYGQVRKGLARDENPLMLIVVRPKIGMKYRTFIGEEAIEALKVYLRDREATRWKCNECGASWRVRRLKCVTPCNGDDISKINLSLEDEDPIFVNQNGRTSTTNLEFFANMRRYAVLSGIVDENSMKSSDINPARSHALRAGFKSTLKMAGMSEGFIDYFMGHEDAYGGAYDKYSNEELRNVYVKHMDALSTSHSPNIKEIESKLSEKIKLQETIIKGLQAQMKEMEEREQNRAMNMAGAPSDPLKVALYRRLLELVESDKELLRDYER